MNDNRPIIVLGLPRSGTSFIARTLHVDMGIEMCTHLRAPFPGREDFDWEDSELSDMLMDGVNQDQKVPFHKIAAYYQKRMDGKLSKYWGVKSPLLCLHPNAIPNAAFVIRAKRNLHDCIKSVHMLPIHASQKMRIIEIQNKCLKSLHSIRTDLVVDVDVLAKYEIRKLLEEKIDEYYYPHHTHVLNDSDDSDG